MINKNRQRQRGAVSEILHRLSKNRLAIVGFVILTLFIVMAVLADHLALFPYDEQHLDKIGKAPCSEFPLGTDNLGRDIYSRLIYGARISLKIGFMSVGIALLLGGTLGALSGFYGGKTDMAIMRGLDVMMAIPNVLLAIVISTTLGTGIKNLILAIGISSVPSYARIVRASTMSLRGQEYIEAARLSGCNDYRIITRHIFPNILAPVIVQVTLGLALAILNASGLSFLGLGVQAPEPEWGSMLAIARSYMRQYPHMVLFPGLAIVFLVLSLNMIGDGLRDALDPRMKN